MNLLPEKMNKDISKRLIGEMTQEQVSEKIKEMINNEYIIIPKKELDNEDTTTNEDEEKNKKSVSLRENVLKNIFEGKAEDGINKNFITHQYLTALSEELKMSKETIIFGEDEGGMKGVSEYVTMIFANAMYKNKDKELSEFREIFHLAMEYHIGYANEYFYRKFGHKQSAEDMAKDKVFIGRIYELINYDIHNIYFSEAFEEDSLIKKFKDSITNLDGFDLNAIEKKIVNWLNKDVTYILERKIEEYKNNPFQNLGFGVRHLYEYLDSQLDDEKDNEESFLVLHNYIANGYINHFERDYEEAGLRGIFQTEITELKDYVHFPVTGYIPEEELLLEYELE